MNPDPTEPDDWEPVGVWVEWCVLVALVLVAGAVLAMVR